MWPQTPPLGYFGPGTPTETPPMTPMFGAPMDPFSPSMPPQTPYGGGPFVGGYAPPPPNEPQPPQQQMMQQPPPQYNGYIQGQQPMVQAPFMVQAQSTAPISYGFAGARTRPAPQAPLDPRWSQQMVPMTVPVNRPQQQPPMQLQMMQQPQQQQPYYGPPPQTVVRTMQTGARTRPPAQMPLSYSSTRGGGGGGATVKTPLPPVASQPTSFQQLIASQTQQQQQQQQQAKAQMRPPASRSKSPTRHRSRSPTRQSPHHPREKDYSFTSTAKTVLSKSEFGVQELRTLFDRLYIVQDFSRLVASWAAPASTIDVTEASLMSVIDSRINYRIESAAEKPSGALGSEPSQQPQPPSMTGSRVRYNAKVVLVSGCPPQPQKEEREKEREDTHLRRTLKFLVGSKDKGLLAFGGHWVASLDGGDPTQETTLIRTAIRTVKDSTGVDLSGCVRWTRFMEVWYDRTEDGGFTEVTVIFVPSMQDVPQKPTAEDGAAAIPTVVVEDRSGQGQKQVVRPMLISLEGILEYNEEDTLERTFEVSLFGELFCLALARGFARKILSVLERPTDVATVPSAEATAATNLDAPAAAVVADGAAPQPAEINVAPVVTLDDTVPVETEAQEDGKRGRDESAEEGAPSEKRTRVGGGTAATESVATETTATSKPGTTEANAPPREVDADVARAFQYFDRNLVGYLRALDVEHLLHSLGLFMSRRYVHAVVARACEKAAQATTTQLPMSPTQPPTPTQSHSHSPSRLFYGSLA